MTGWSQVFFYLKKSVLIEWDWRINQLLWSGNRIVYIDCNWLWHNLHNLLWLYCLYEYWLLSVLLSPIANDCNYHSRYTHQYQPNDQSCIWRRCSFNRDWKTGALFEAFSSSFPVSRSKISNTTPTIGWRIHLFIRNQVLFWTLKIILLIFIRRKTIELIDFDHWNSNENLPLQTCPLTSVDNLLIIYGQVIPPRLVKAQQDTIHCILSKGDFQHMFNFFTKIIYLHPLLYN